MAIDWTKIDGYREDMSAEEKLGLLDNVEIAPKGNEGDEEKKPTPPDLKGYVSKVQFDKTASELAAVKKQLRAKMTDDETKEADRQAAQEAMENELKELRREKTLSNHRASFLSQGYDEALAEEAAVAMTDGDTDAVFAAMKKHTANQEKALRAQILKDTPKPPADDGDDAKKKKEMDALRASFGLPPLK